MKKNSSGFTLIELLITMAIIAILAGIMYASLGEPKFKARDARRIAELNSIQDAVELYFLQNGSFPDNLDLLQYSFGGPIPRDPQSGDPYNYRKYTTPSIGYCLGTKLERPITSPSTCAPGGSTSNYKIWGP